MSWQAKLATLSLDELRQLASSLNLPCESASKDSLCCQLKKRLKSDSKAQKLLLGFFVATNESSHAKVASKEKPTKVPETTEDRLKKSVASLREELKKSKKEQTALKTQLKSSRREAGKLGEQMAALSKRNEALQEEVASLKGKVARASHPKEATVRDSSALFARTQEVAKLRQEVKELSKKVSFLSRKKGEKLSAQEARLKKRLQKLEQDCKELQAKKRRLEDGGLAKGSYIGTYLRQDKGGVIVAQGQKDLFTDQFFLDSEQVLVCARKKSQKVRSCDQRQKSEIFAVVKERDGELFVADKLLIGKCKAELVVKAIYFKGEEKATLERVLNDKEVINRLLGEKPKKLRKKASKSKSKPKRQEKPGKSAKVLIVGGDRVGPAYVAELAQRSIKAQWYSGFGGLLGRERGLGGVSLVLLILSQASHTMVASVEEAARLANCLLVKTMSRGKKKVADIIEKELNKVTSFPDDD